MSQSATTYVPPHLRGQNSREARQSYTGHHRQTSISYQKREPQKSPQKNSYVSNNFFNPLNGNDSNSAVVEDFPSLSDSTKTPKQQTNAGWSKVVKTMEQKQSEIEVQKKKDEAEQLQKQVELAKQNVLTKKITYVNKELHFMKSNNRHSDNEQAESDGASDGEEDFDEHW